MTRLALSFAALLALGTALPAQAAGPDAEQLLQDLGSAERIAQSGKLRMLSQRISASACNRAAGIATADADKQLSRSLRDYGRIVVGLEDGDAGLGLYGPESDRAVLSRVDRLQELWAPIDALFQETPAEALTHEHVVTLAAAAPEMLDVSKILVSDVVAQYSDPTQMAQSDAILLMIAERQRMLEQEISNATCLIAEGIDVPAARDQLSDAVAMYDVSLNALRTGMPEAGVAAPPTAAIDLWLGDIAERWSAMQPVLTKVRDSGEITEEERTFVFVETNKLTWMMNVTVGQYTEASKARF